MKKNIFKSTIALMATALLASCGVTISDLEGEWADEMENGATETWIFGHPSNTTTGPYSEKIEWVDEDTDEDGLEYSIGYTVTIDGKYTYDTEGLSIEYDMESMKVEIDRGCCDEYALKNMEAVAEGKMEAFYPEGTTAQDLGDFFESSFNDRITEHWTKIYEDENEDFKTHAYKNLSIEEDVLIVKLSDGEKKLKKVVK